MELTNRLKAGVADIVRQALDRLNDLQLRIDMFLEFLIEIQGMVKKTSERSDWIFTPAQNREERGDADIKKVRI
jgi:hypothetical protein